MTAERIALRVARPRGQHVASRGLRDQRFGRVQVDGEIGHRPQRDSAGGRGAQPQAVGVEREYHHGLGVEQGLRLIGGALEYARCVQAGDGSQALHKCVQKCRLRHQLTAELAAPLLGGPKPQRVSPNRPDREHAEHADHDQAREQWSDGGTHKRAGDEVENRRERDGERCQRSDHSDRPQPRRGINR